MNPLAASLHRQTVFRRLSLALLLIFLGGCESISREPVKAAGDERIIQPPVKLPAKADRVVIEKSQRKLVAYAGKQAFLTYHVALGRNPVGPKTCSGDYRTPEGHYKVTGRNYQSRFHKSLRLSYPNPADVARARQKGCNPGGDIVIHGLENGFGYVGHTHRQVDWTSGCIAVTNQEMDQLMRLIPVGTPVHIIP